MNYVKQLMTVTSWEFSRFFKPKNEAIGIVVMLATSVIFYFGTGYILSDASEKTTLRVYAEEDPLIAQLLEPHYHLQMVSDEEKAAFIEQLKSETDDVLLEIMPDTYIVHAYKSTRTSKKLKERLDAHHTQRELQKAGISPETLALLVSPAPVVESFVYTDNSGKRLVLSYFFAGLMIMALFLSFAYQFTAITGEKQLKITEQIVSAISPQVWMDGKILGITLTGISSMLTYALLSVIGGVLFFQFTGSPLSSILAYIYLPSIAIYLPFALVGILIWNALLASVASIITDPNNSGKSGLMMLPMLFVILSFLVIRDPDNSLSVFLSWFPLTSATAMPMRWALTEMSYWQVAGSFATLILTFYALRKLAAKIFRVSILITGKEPTFSEVFRLAKQA